MQKRHTKSQVSCINSYPPGRLLTHEMVTEKQTNKQTKNSQSLLEEPEKWELRRVAVGKGAGGGITEGWKQEFLDGESQQKLEEPSVREEVETGGGGKVWESRR